MLLDSVVGLKELHVRFAQFVNSQRSEQSFPAATDGDPAPYDGFLQGLRVIKSSGVSSLTLAADQWLEFVAPLEELSNFGKLLYIEDDGDHHHWYSKPIALIIEADDWRAQNT